MSYFHKFFFRRRIIFKKELLRKKKKWQIPFKGFLIPLLFLSFFFYRDVVYSLRLILQVTFQNYPLSPYPPFPRIISLYRRIIFILFLLPCPVSRIFPLKKLFLRLHHVPSPTFFNSSLPRRYKILSKSFTLSFTLIPFSFIAKKQILIDSYRFFSFTFRSIIIRYFSIIGIRTEFK